MHDAPNEIQPSLLERLAQLSSDDVRKMMHSKGAGKMEKFGMFLFKTPGCSMLQLDSRILCAERCSIETVMTW
mgnify:CR=1 FL=1